MWRPREDIILAILVMCNFSFIVFTINKWCWWWWWCNRSGTSWRRGYRATAVLAGNSRQTPKDSAARKRVSMATATSVLHWQNETNPSSVCIAQCNYICSKVIQSHDPSILINSIRRWPGKWQFGAFVLSRPSNLYSTI